MQIPSLKRMDRNARRLTEIFAVLGKYGLADWLGGLRIDWLQRQLVSFDGERLSNVSHEARIRLALIELGTTFIKFGQVLSTRADLVGAELASEMSQLRSNTPPDSVTAVKSMIQAELGKPVEELFAEFEEKAFASASIGQVHRAKLHDGQVVVVKVQHTGIEEKIASDLEIMAFLADFIQKHVTQFRPYQPLAVVREFRRTILKELDFACERRNLEEFTRNFADNATVHFPITYPDLSSQRVLTMEMLTGTSFENAAGLRQAGVDLNEIVCRGVNAYLEMIFTNGFYHADPHPGNLILLPDGVIGIIDGGMIGRVDDHLREEIECMLLGVIHKDPQEVTDVVVRLGSPPPDLDIEGLRSDLNEFNLEYGSRALRDFNVGEALNDITDIIHRYRVFLPAGCSLLLKTLVMLEGTSHQLNPSFSLAELIQPYEEKSLQRRFSTSKLWGKMSRAYRDWDRLMEQMPRDLSVILQHMRSGNYEIKHEHRRLETTVNHLVMGLLIAALFLGSTELWSRGIPPTLHDVSIPGVLGYFLALVLGFRLFRRIVRMESKSGEP